MGFVDEIGITVQAGRGGNGCVSYRREKFVPRGGPDGGDGGNGGDVLMRVNPNLSTLFEIGRRRKYRAGDGKHGAGGKKTGRSGASIHIGVPAGTLIRDRDTGKLLGDLTEPDQEIIVARGGAGGKGNARFATATHQTPDRAEAGQPGESHSLHLELKLLADVGLVGLPNAGKSTLLSRISAARPKISGYPFTTLTPNLGFVRLPGYRSIVAADIPGLIEGAHAGKGLGDRFLRHIARTRILIFLIEADAEDPDKVLGVLRNELAQFDASLLRKSGFVVLTKTDILTQEQIQKLPDSLGGIDCIPISSLTGYGLDRLVARLSDETRRSRDG
ncbi:MAG TPA: GTPase ObgE [bacterium]|nr:GTPase ObgE [bacterium]